jgi:ParB/RepB/Spo0J family partition protein
MTARKVRETDIAAAPPPPAEADGFMHVVLTDIAESPFNPRRSFDTDALAELASSIREVGVLQPLVVRRVGDSAGYDLVCGARRLRAARLAGLERVPCIVRELSDIEAAHARLIENCQRQDVSPIEEAVAFRRLEELGEDAEEIGGRIGRPKRYVRDRLALLLLPERLQQLVDIGLVHLGAGVFVARLEADVRAVVLERVLEEFEGEGGELLVDVEAMTLSEARRIASAHQRQFRSAPWSLDDASLAPVGAGACAVCPCNTATQPDLFGVPPDGGTGSCARPTCWDERTASYWERVQADHKAKGGTVGSAPRQRLHGVQRRSDDGVYEYVLVDTLAAKAGVAGVLVQNPYGVGFTTCYSAPDVAAGLEAAGEANLAELVREQYARAGSYSDSQKAAEAA